MELVQLSSAEISYLDSTPPASGNSSVVNPRTNALPVLLIHGFSSSIVDNWVDTNWVKFLNETGFRVIGLDIRGHGNSQKFYSQEDYSLAKMAGDAIDLLDHLKIAKTHIIGYSMGARVAAKLAMDHANRVERLILGGNGYGMIEGGGGWNIVRDGLLAKHRDEITDPRARAFRAFAERTGSDRRALAACILGSRQNFSENDFAGISSTTLIAIGEDDDIAGSGEKLAACMSEARFFSIARRDHMRATGDKTFKNEAALFLQEG